MTDLQKKLLTPAEASSYLNIPEANLNVWRSTKKEKIPYIKIGKNVRYQLEDLDAYIESQKIHE